jgi:FAD/FMN-containing dehydrogenase
VRTSEVFAPRTEEELVDLVDDASRRGRSFGAQGASLSFDGQGLPDDIAISTRNLRKIEIDPAARRLVAGAGVTVGEAAASALAHGLVIPILPSASRITVGGTASTNAYSRMTPGLGRESRYIRSIRLVTPRGTVHRCSREDNPRLFHASIGGFGLVGIITEVEYELSEVGDHPAFASSAHAFDGVDGLAHLLPEHPPPGLEDGRAWPGAGSVVMCRGPRIRTMITRHRYQSTAKRKRTIAHQNGGMRLGVELLVRRAPRLSSWLWQRNWVPGKRVRFVDDVLPATFFMDANLRASQLLQRIGRNAPVMQQSFVLPIASRDGEAVRGVESFVREAFARFREAGLVPSMFDVGFMPAAGPFLLSGNQDRDAFLVSAAFLVSPSVRPDAVRRAFGKLTHVCRSDHGGIVHLTKQAFCDDDILRDDYAEAIRELGALRAEHDPNGSLQNGLSVRLGLA